MRGLLQALIVASAAMVWVTSAAAGQISVTWSAVPGATGYHVYYGPSSGNYTGSVTVSTNQATLSSLQDCSTWYVAVKAFNSAGESPTFSNEVSGWPRPSLSTVTPSAAMQGQQVVVDIYGSNFQPGAVVDFQDPNIVVGSIAIPTCGHVQVLATVEPTAGGVPPAKAGPVNLMVVNPDTVYGLNNAAFQIAVNPARFDVNKSDSATTNRLDGKDIVWMARMMLGVSYPDPNYDPDFDFDGDGEVSGADLAYLGGANYGGCWTGSGWSVSACSGGLK